LFKVTFDTSSIEHFAKNAKGIELDVQKIINWYINKVYADLYKQHSSPYAYVTPPGARKKRVSEMSGRDRKNLRKRTGRLLADLKNAKFTRKTDSGTWESGFNIRRGSYLNLHVGERTDAPTKLLAGAAGPTFKGRILIPLKAALNPNGTVKPITASSLAKMKILPFHVASEMNRVDMGTEDPTKFHKFSLIIFKSSGRKLIPLYVLAKKIEIPKRVFIGEKMLQYYDDLYDKLDDEIEKQLNKLFK
jgi:hypothetical protein